MASYFRRCWNPTVKRRRILKGAGTRQRPSVVLQQQKDAKPQALRQVISNIIQRLLQYLLILPFQLILLQRFLQLERLQILLLLQRLPVAAVHFLMLRQR